MPTVQLRNDECHIELSGDVTIYRAEALLQMLLPLLGSGEVSIDLSQVTEIDSSGVQLLLIAKKQQQQKQQGLTLIGPSEPVRTVIDQLGLADWFNVQELDAATGEPLINDPTATADPL